MVMLEPTSVIFRNTKNLATALLTYVCEVDALTSRVGFDAPGLNPSSVLPELAE